MKNNSSFPVPHYAVLRRRQHQVTSISWLLKHIPAGSCLFTSPQHSGCQSFFWQSQLSAIEPHSHLQPHFSLIPLWWDNILANKVACCCSPYLPHPLYSCQSDLYFKVPGNLQWILFFFFAHTMQQVWSEFPKQGLNPCLLHWKHGDSTTGPSGKSL